MLNNVQKGTRVTLANGKKATVTEVATGWDNVVYYSITADGGKFKTRSYIESGEAVDEEGGDWDVVSIDSTYVEAPSLASQGGALTSEVAFLKEIVSDLVTQVDLISAKVTAVANTTIKVAAPTSNSFMHDFGYGLVPAHRHINAAYRSNLGGDEGGIVADTAFVDATCRVGRGSFVCGNAKVINGSRIINNSTVGGSAVIDGAVVNGQTVITGTLRVVA